MTTAADRLREDIEQMIRIKEDVRREIEDIQEDHKKQEIEKSGGIYHEKGSRPGHRSRAKKKYFTNLRQFEGEINRDFQEVVDPGYNASHPICTMCENTIKTEKYYVGEDGLYYCNNCGLGKNNTQKYRTISRQKKRRNLKSKKSRKKRPSTKKKRRRKY